MRDKQTLNEQYADLLNEQANTALVQLIGDLNTFYTAPKPPTNLTWETIKARHTEKTLDERLASSPYRFFPFFRKPLSRGGKVALLNIFEEESDALNSVAIPTIRQKRPLQRRLAMITAVAFAALLVGSLVVVLNMARKSTTIGLASLCSSLGKSKFPPAPVVSKEKPGQSGLYLAEENGIYRFALQDGHLQPLWVYKMNGCSVTPTVAPGLENGPRPPVPGVTTAATVAHDMAYFGVREAAGTYLYAIHTSDGSFAWKTKVDLLNQPMVLNNLLYIETTDDVGHDVIMALSAIDGSIRWSYRYPLAVTDQSEGLGATGDSKVYVSTSNTIFALDAMAGKQVWNINIEPSQIISATRFFDGILYATASSTCFNCEALAGTSAAYAINPANGSHLWETQKVAGYLSPPTETQGIVYFGSIDGYVHAVRISNGQQLWRFYTGGEVRAAPQVAEGIVYVGAGLFLGVGNPNTDNAHILALDAAHGGKKWSFAIHDANYDDTRPIVEANGVVYISAWLDYLYLVHASNGTLVQLFPISGRRSSANGISPTLTFVT